VVLEVPALCLLDSPTHSNLIAMSQGLSPKELQGQTAPPRPPLPAACIDLELAAILCRVPTTAAAEEAYKAAVKTIGEDLEALAKHAFPVFYNDGTRLTFRCQTILVVHWGPRYSGRGMGVSRRRRRLGLRLRAIDGAGSF